MLRVFSFGKKGPNKSKKKMDGNDKMQCELSLGLNNCNIKLLAVTLMNKNQIMSTNSKLNCL